MQANRGGRYYETTTGDAPQLEVKTDAPLSVLKAARDYAGVNVRQRKPDGNHRWWNLNVIQAQANVVEPWEEGRKETP